MHVWNTLLGTFGTLHSWCSFAHWSSHRSDPQYLFQKNDSQQSTRLHHLGHFSSTDRSSDGSCNALPNEGHFSKLRCGRQTCICRNAALLLLGWLPYLQQTGGLAAGISGAMTFFNPLRPFLGVASIALLSVTLLLRIRVLRRGCPVDLSNVTTATR